MAWVACWTPPRSHPSQQLGEQGHRGRDLSLSPVPPIHSQAPLFLLILSRLTCPTPQSSISLSSLALFSEIEGSLGWLVSMTLLVLAMGLGP